MSWSKKEKVLVPIDFSDESIRAVDAALDMVEKASHIHVIHVLPVLASTEPGVVWDSLNDDARREQTDKALRDRLSAAEYQGLNFSVSIGDPGTEITAEAQEKGADLIVMPSHGRTGLKRLLIGSVAERTCRLAHCPVLILRD